MFKIKCIKNDSHPAPIAWMAISFLLLARIVSPLNAANPEACNDYIAYKTSEIPFFDGVGDEEFWQNCPWYAIDQVWLPYNNDLNYPDATKESSSTLIKNENDFSGKFKLAWNEEENMLYLLALITDDVFVSGYAGIGNYSGYDVLEIFVDEDASGGPHEYDIVDEDIAAANAFAYHVNATPYADRIETMCSAMDLAGNAAKVITVNYHNHFPYFSIRKDENTYTYELALKLYTAKVGVAYETNEANDYEALLYEEKPVGFSLAYCDNDKPGIYTRDHFIGSSYLPPGKNNSNYQTADRFGRLTLKGEFISSEDIAASGSSVAIYPNPVGESAVLSFGEETSRACISLLSPDGRLLEQFYNGDVLNGALDLPFSGISQGIYLIRITTDKETILTKIIKK